MRLEAEGWLWSHGRQMIRYWITAHWPELKGQADLHSGVWVTDDNRSIITRVQPDDLVAIYESGSGPASRVARADGSYERLSLQRGRQGVVELHRVVALAREPEDSEPETYWDPSSMDLCKRLDSSCTASS